MKRLCIALLVILFTFISLNINAMQAAFYVLRYNSVYDGPASHQLLSTIKQHRNQINLLISQSYIIDKHGTVWGSLNPKLVKLAHQLKIPLVAMVVNADYNRNDTKEFLKDTTAQQNAINMLLQICKKYQLNGIQIDFEGFGISQKADFTQFYTNLAKAMRKDGYSISLAIVPSYSQVPKSKLGDLGYDGWSGIYDLKALAKVSNFISVMSYNQHGGFTTPGPVAGVPWMQSVIKYMLQYIPANKLSLGIPTYSSYWQTKDNGRHIAAQGNQIGYQTAMNILKHANAKLSWSSKNKVNYAIFMVDNLNTYLFMENAKSFAAKLALVKKYNLRGISVFRIDTSDPGIWKVLSDQKN